MSTAATSSWTGQCEASRLSDPAKKKARASPDRPGAPARPSPAAVLQADRMTHAAPMRRSEEHTSELQSLMRISYAVFWLKKTRLQPLLKNVYDNSDESTE